MIPYLSKIPNNQHKKLPKKISTKKSYLIPRDLIGRILSKMNISIFPLILGLLDSKNQEIISESVDIFAYMVFHNKSLESLDNFMYLEKLFDLYSNNDLILWKIIMASSAFRQDYSIDFLIKINNILNNDIIKQEISRSIELIEKYNK
ncbi:hypothetical protein LJB96_01595 [Methanobrevibacter sp. OttesenSCG-928-K11]|nr:hypothetical protein [Methanobrevibacter sp. OttesenSCG-928-K11]MDL2270601.1 hypothetical protein [Methanobrevibacter sp. OttesenSCG-928-I08]